MASKRYRDRPEVEEKFVRQELIGGWITIAARVLSFILALTCGALLLIDPGHWHLAAGSAGISTALRLFIASPRPSGR